MSDVGRLAMSGPEVIEASHGVEEFDSRDRALVWRTTGGKHRYLLGDCQALVADSIDAFRAAALAQVDAASSVELTLAALEQEQALLTDRIARFGHVREPMELWRTLGVQDPEALPLLEADAFVAQVNAFRLGAR